MSIDKNHQHVSMKRLIFVLAVFMIPMLACGGANPLNGLKEIVPTAVAPVLGRTEQILRDATLALDTNSADWQRIVQETRERLLAEGETQIVNDLDGVFQRGIAAGSAEIRCNIDFIGQRVREDIQGILDRLLGYSTRRKPTICQVTPQTVELSDQAAPLYDNKIQIAGYNFDSDPLPQVQLVGNNGTQDISSVLGRPSPYYMTLNLGDNGVPFATDSNLIIVQWEGQELSRISVIQPRTPVCQTIADTSPEGYGSFVPLHTRGDLDSNGNGPKIDITVSLNQQETSIFAQIYMKAEETKEDWTTSEGTSNPITLYTAPAGWRIKRVITESWSEYHKTDGDVAVDVEQRGPGGLVNRFEVTGDTKSDEDAGVRTGVSVTFNPIQVELEQVGNCVSS